MGWPDLTFRSRMEPELRNELDQLVALMIGWNAHEHGPDGQHTTITVNGIQFRNADGTIFATITVGPDGIVVTYLPTTPASATPPVTTVTSPMQIGDVLVGHTHGVVGQAWVMRSGIDLNTDSPATDTGGKWLFGVGQDALTGGARSALVFGYYVDPAVTFAPGPALYYLTDPTFVDGYAFAPPQAGSTKKYKLGMKADARLRWDEINGKAIDASLGYTERGRTVPLGEWIDIPFNAANFSGIGGMTMIVGSQQAYAYTLIGKTMTIAWYLAAITVGGTLSTAFSIAIPAGYLSARATFNAGAGVDNGTALSTYQQVQPGGAAIFVVKVTQGPWSASAGGTQLYGQITFSIQ